MFLGAVIKPNRIYLRKRTFGNFYQKILFFNKIADQKKINSENQEMFILSMNSYLGFMIHSQTYKLRRKILKRHLSCRWNNWVTLIKNKKFIKKIEIQKMIGIYFSH